MHLRAATDWTEFFFCLVSGKSTFAVQADIQPGGQISRWIWRCGPLPASKHLGEALGRNLLSSDLLLPLDLGWSCPSSLAWGETASLHFSSVSNSGLVIQTDTRPVVGTSFYLVPSFVAFLSLFDHLRLPVSCSYIFFFQQSFQRKLAETLIQSCDFWGNKLSLFRNRMCAFVWLTQSSQMSC